MIKAQMSMEYIIKILILLVLVVTIIALIIKFSDDIKRMVKDLFPEKNDYDFPQLFEKSSFSAGEISAYVESCYSTMSSLPEDEQSDEVCYILQAENGFTITQDDLINKLSAELKGKTQIITDFSKGIIKIQYQDVENNISVRD